MERRVVPWLTVNLFGVFETQIEGVPQSGLKAGAKVWLLALLILRRGKAVNQQWYLDQIWSEQIDRGEVDKAITNFHQTLKRLRDTLGKHGRRILTKKSEGITTLSLDLDGADVDLFRFDEAVKRGDTASLAEAVNIYRGSLLDGCDLLWVAEERLKRELQCLEAREYLAHYALESGEYEKAIGLARLIIARHPGCDSAVRLLMRALAANGEYSAAIAAYRDLRLIPKQIAKQNKNTAFVEPSAETVALYQRIRSDMERALAAAPVAPPFPSRYPSSTFPSIT